MLSRLLPAAAFALGLSSVADAQTIPMVVQTCGVGVALPLGPGGSLTQDQTGVLCVGSASGPQQNVTNAPSSASTAAIAPTNGGTQTAYVAKGSAGNLYGFSATMATTAGFLAILNSATAPASGAAITPLECIALPANGYVARRQDIPDRYSAGITAVVSSSCTTYTAVAPLVTTLLVQ